MKEFPVPVKSTQLATLRCRLPNSFGSHGSKSNVNMNLTESPLRKPLGDTEVGEIRLHHEGVEDHVEGLAGADVVVQRPDNLRRPGPAVGQELAARERIRAHGDWSPVQAVDAPRNHVR